MADYLAMNEFPGTGAIMQVAISFAGNRPDDNSGTTPYFDPADVKGEIITPATATTVEVVEPVVLSLVNATTFKTDRIVPTGKVLRVSRNTLISYPMVDFVDRQIVTENDLDVSSRQVLYAAMEALDKSNLSIKYARQGLTFASAATVTANAAKEQSAAAAGAASNAVTTANAAATNAAAAVRSANSAQQASELALQAARSADQHATNVETLAAAADAASAQAMQTANEAKSIASGIDAKATSAQQQAGTAVTTANNAKATAEGIDAKATSAVQTANDASSKAASAKATAEGVDAKATSAQTAADNANTTATQAAGTASEAKRTADGLAASVDKASGDASAASLAAKAANDNANSRVAKAGDTMTGELKVPSWRVGTRWFNGNGLSADGANGYARVEADRFYLDSLNAIYMKATAANANLLIQAVNNQGAARGAFYNQPDGSWVLANANNRTASLDAAGNWSLSTGAFYGPNGKKTLNWGDRVPAANESQMKFLSNGTNFGIQNGTGNEALQVNNGGNDAAGALMSFHRENSFACYFGLDTDNQLAVGGWSMGQRRYKIWHEGNLNPPDYVRYDNLRQELGGRGVNEVGTIVFCQTVDGNTRGPGDLVGAGGLRYGSSNSALGYGPNAGTFRCLGYGNNGGVTAWLRIN